MICKILRLIRSIFLYCIVLNGEIKMQLLKRNKITNPVKTSGWEEVSLGFSLFELRLVSYGIIAFFFILNGLSIYIIGMEYIQGAMIYLRENSIFKIPVLIIIYSFAYFLLHELLHLVFHPDRGLSNRSLFGMASGTFFVIYNEKINRKRFLYVISAPFVILTIVFIAIIILAEINIITVDNIILVNILGLHLSACVGDVLIFYKIYKLSNVSEVWNSYTTVWVR